MQAIEKNGNEVKINIFPKQEEFISSECDDVLFGGAVAGGKQLNVNTFLPTPEGYKKMGEMEIGDFVLSPRGVPVKVVAVSPVEIPREAYELEFDSGEKIQADARHLWKTMDVKERNQAWRLTDEFREQRRLKRPSRALANSVKQGTQASVSILNCIRKYEYKNPPTGSIRTTEEIFNTQKYRHISNHSVDVTSPIDFPGANLLIEPYLLGLWLGDGYSHQGTFGKPVDDMQDILSYVERSFKTRLDNRVEKNLPCIYATPENLTTDLRSMDLLHNKHIPAIYKRASLKQRLALLQGLCDTDGTCAADGQIEIGFMNKVLAEDVHELVSSLGIKTQIHEKKAMLNGKDYGTYYRMVFMSSFPCFRLKRKLERQKLTDLRDTVRRRYIVSVKKIAPVPMRCIQVDHSDGMYLVGKSFIPTHNSYAVMLGALKRRLEFPGSSGIIFRRTYPELEKSIIRTTRELYPLFGATYNEAKHVWTFPNKSTLEFGFCEKDGDAYKYLSAEYHDVWFDEATTFTEFQLRYLTSRCRSSMPGIKPLVRLTSNPGGVSHAFIYSRYIKPAQISKIWKDSTTGKTRSFIPAKISDNPALNEADPDYINRLKELPEKKYLALAEGRWDVFEGAYFDNFDPRPGHGVLSYLRKPDSYTMKFLSMDWGFSDPAAVHWHEVTPMGRIFTYRELYTTRRSPKELALDILSMCPPEEEYMYLVASPEIWGKRIETEGGGEPIQRLMESVLKDRIIMKKANNARVPGWLKMREYMCLAPDGLPWWQISPNCINLIHEIPNLVHDDKKKEDISGQCSDHSCESIRYGLVSLNEVPKHIVTPYESNYDRIFGIVRDKPKEDQMPIPVGHGGY